MIGSCLRCTKWPDLMGTRKSECTLFCTVSNTYAVVLGRSVIDITSVHCTLAFLLLAIKLGYTLPDVETYFHMLEIIVESFEGGFIVPPVSTF